MLHVLTCVVGMGNAPLVTFVFVMICTLGSTALNVNSYYYPIPSRHVIMMFFSIVSCAYGYAWADKAYENDGHAPAECSNRGLCDTTTVSVRC